MRYGQGISQAIRLSILLKKGKRVLFVARDQAFLDEVADDLILKWLRDDLGVRRVGSRIECDNGGLIEFRTLDETPRPHPDRPSSWWLEWVEEAQAVPQKAWEDLEAVDG